MIQFANGTGRRTMRRSRSRSRSRHVLGAKGEKMFKLLALSLAALAMANTTAPDAGKTAAEWAAHPPDADAVFAFKRNNGDETLKGVRYELEGLARKQAGLPLTGINSSCTYPQWYDNMMPYVALALDI